MAQIYEDLTVVRPDDAYIVLFITECFVQLFGWNLESLCLTAHQNRCQAFLSAGQPDEALEAHKYMMDAIDESAKASCLDWSNGKFSASSEATVLTRISEFKERCSALVEQNDRVLSACIPFLNCFVTHCYTGGDPGARTRWL
jgi:hypothetical protein